MQTTPATLRCRCSATKDKDWHLVCATCWARLPAVLQEEVNAAYQARRGHWNEPARVERHWVAMKQCMRALGPLPVRAMPILEGPKLMPGIA